MLLASRAGGDLALVPQPMGKPARDFRLVRATLGSVVFENAGDDRVARISYAVTGNELVARVEFRADGRHVKTSDRAQPTREPPAPCRGQDSGD